MFSLGSGFFVSDHLTMEENRRNPVQREEQRTIENSLFRLLDCDG
jgi:hypothetical protein